MCLQIIISNNSFYGIWFKLYLFVYEIAIPNTLLNKTHVFNRKQFKIVRIDLKYGENWNMVHLIS